VADFGHYSRVLFEAIPKLSIGLLLMSRGVCRLGYSTGFSLRTYL